MWSYLMVEVSYSPILGQVCADLSYCPHLMIGFDSVAVVRGGRLSAMYSV
jgi:hypothetical protein